MTRPLNTQGLRWFETSPPAGDPMCTCSYCDQVITDAVPIRFWNVQGQEARLHPHCFALCTGTRIESAWHPTDDTGDLLEQPDSDPSGPCCACRRHDVPVPNMVMLPWRAPIPGTGWGCVTCQLPPDGAVAVLCDACLESHAPIRDCCLGYAMTWERSPCDPSFPFIHTVPH